MRSETVAWLLSLYGYNIYVLKGGYKAFRRWALKQLEKEYQFNILGGYTGSGKTEVLKEMMQEGIPVIDLEGLANHRGSSFGSLGQEAQPTQEMFENMLALELFKHQTGEFDKEKLGQCILNIQKRLGGLETKNALQYLEEGKVKECFEILIRYYDKLYGNGLSKRENSQSVLNKIPCKSVDQSNAKHLLNVL